MATLLQAGHQPRLVRHADGRYTVRCEQCERLDGVSMLIGIGVPISSQFEAESIFKNHGGRAA